ncbi:hypothetical protein AVEN_235631-1 [Araneus ventricosus]|uniref:Tc1-like transposase DDE domain-containing protein n=1 Tax=Araneus ventricosus TaxID=182803 RepID=A0A4Y2BSY5_ARAVE|nr:hypothetical protein AVEN_235631-1 [Araneus ventricosus]
MTVSLKDCALLVKLFYKNNDCAPVALQEFRTLKDMKKGVGPMTVQTDEGHFHLTGYVNTQNCRIWATENPLETQPVPLHPAKVNVWCGFTASYIIGPYCFKETGALGPVTVTGQRYECLLRNHVIPALQQRGCVDRIIFMQDGAPPQIANPVKQHFGNARIISRHFPTAWPSRSPDLNPCDFWLWGYLKDVVFSTQIAHLAEVKARIAQHILNVTPETLRSVVEHAVSGFQLFLKTVDSILNRFCTSLAKFKNQFDGCLLCGFWPQDN